MRDAILGFLAPVRRRRHWQFALRAISVGVAVGALACAVVILADRALGRSPGPPAAWAALLAGPLVAGLICLARRPSWQSIAALVDDRCRLHDRTSAALEFSAKAAASDFEQLQVRDAVRQLATIRPVDVAPLGFPRESPIALGFLAVAVGLLVQPIFSTPARAVGPGLFESALAEARQLEEPARQMEAAAQDLQSPALKAIAERMRQTIAELRQPGIDMRETMAKLSELQAFVAEAQKDYDHAPVDGELQSLGEAMVEAKPLEPAGKALQEQKLEQAARALEQARSASFDRREAKAVEPRLKQSAESMKSRGLAGLSRATAGLAAGVKGDPESLKQGTQELAKEIREHERRKRINELMAREQRRLSDCKNRCEARNLIAQRQQEEQQQGGAKSDRARSGTIPGKSQEDGSTGDEPKKTDGNREEIAGRAGEDAPADIEENGQSMQGNNTPARRPSLKVHQKYQRESEAVLDREPIPLGHRESIRRYFELIRPPAGDGEPSAGSSGRALEP
jgi:hypothetical protein